MIHIVGAMRSGHKKILDDVLCDSNIDYKYSQLNQVAESKVISVDKESTMELQRMEISFYNWDLLFNVEKDISDKDLKDRIIKRVEVLASIMSLKTAPLGIEFHGSIRVSNIAYSAKFYSWLFGVEPKEWTHRYVTFVRKDTKFNFVLLVSDGKELNQDTLYHLGMGVRSKEEVVQFYHSALDNGFIIEKLPRTTWRGTPLHELWLKDPDGTLIEIYSRLTEDELKTMPDDKEPTFLV
jgi:catechol 2,3-dioxygenase-like lactoylglutathione lyase family enzyme